MLRNRFARKALVATSSLLAVAALGGTAGASAGRGGEWQPLAFPPYDAACGATTVHVSAVKNMEFYRETTLPDGTVRWQVTGSLVLNYATDDGASVTVNASGPGNLLTFPSGDVQVLAHGRNSFTFTPEQAATLGVPQISVSAGPFDVTFHSDGTASGHLGTIIKDVCAELT